MSNTTICQQETDATRMLQNLQIFHLTLDYHYASLPYFHFRVWSHFWNLQLVEVVFGAHRVPAEVGHHLGPAAGAEADRRRAVGGGQSAEGHAGEGQRRASGAPGPTGNFYSCPTVIAGISEPFWCFYSR